MFLCVSVFVHLVYLCVCQMPRWPRASSQEIISVPPPGEWEAASGLRGVGSGGLPRASLELQVPPAGPSAPQPL